MGTWPGGIAAITLFVEDLEGSRSFYGRTFGLPVAHEDDTSAVFRFQKQADQPAPSHKGA